MTHWFGAWGINSFPSVVTLCGSSSYQFFYNEIVATLRTKKWGRRLSHPQALLVLGAVVITLTSARPSTDEPTDAEDSLQIQKRDVKSDRSFNSCYKKDRNGHPIKRYHGTGSTAVVSYECERQAPSLCARGIPKYGFARCTVTKKRYLDSTTAVAIECGCAPFK